MDPGTRVVGYGVLELRPAPTVFRYVECGVLKANEADDIGARIHELVAGLREVIEEFSPFEVALEAAFHGPNASSALKLAEARGAFRELCVARSLLVAEYAPARVKRAVVGTGRATKHDVQMRVGLLCELDVLPRSDAADALAVAICHAQSRVHPGRVLAGATVKGGTKA